MLRRPIRSSALASNSTLVLLTAVLVVVAPLALAQSTTSTAEAKQHYHNAVVAIGKSDWQKAKAELVQAEKLAPQNALVHYDLALAYSHTGSSKAAQSEIDKALRLGLPPEQKQAAEQLKSSLENPAPSSSTEKAEQHVEGPSLDETLGFLNRLISDGEAVITNRISSAKTSQDRYSATKVVISYPTMQCLVGWSEVHTSQLFRDGTVDHAFDRRDEGYPGDYRNYISLKDVYISDLRVMDLKSYTGTDPQYNHGIDLDDTDTISGYVLFIRQDSAKAMRLNPTIAQLSGIASDPRQNTRINWGDPRIFFATEGAAERARKALAHAAALCGAKADPF
jgi:hypothetical protein